MPNQEITRGLDDQIIKKFEKSKVYSSFRDNILAADIVDMQLISKYDEGIHFYHVSLISIVNMQGLFQSSFENVLQLWILSQTKQNIPR